MGIIKLQEPGKILKISPGQLDLKNSYDIELCYNKVKQFYDEWEKYDEFIMYDSKYLKPFCELMYNTTTKTIEVIGDKFYIIISGRKYEVYESRTFHNDTLEFSSRSSYDTAKYVIEHYGKLVGICLTPGCDELRNIHTQLCRYCKNGYYPIELNN